MLDPEALTIGFARRFATYKRATLLFKDPARLAKILTDAKRPVQFIFAGKAHPRDNEGKELIREIVHFAAQFDVRRRIVFLEDYDINIAKMLVQGVDVWLNNPRRPWEASGTSGMKAAINGALNMSTLDGWWCEGYKPDDGWAIGSGETYDDAGYQDMVESQAIYNMLENEVVPLFYTRSADNLPKAWIHRVRKSMRRTYAAVQHTQNGNGICAAVLSARPGKMELSDPRQSEQGKDRLPRGRPTRRTPGRTWQLKTCRWKWATAKAQVSLTPKIRSLKSVQNSRSTP